MNGCLVLMVVVVWTIGGVKGIVRPGLDQQVTKESQDARSGAWPPPAVFEIPDPVESSYEHARNRAQGRPGYGAERATKSIACVTQLV